jgi:hypothetical protein
MFGYIGTISYLRLKRYSSSLAMIKPKILVTGATGKTGGAIATDLLAKVGPYVPPSAYVMPAAIGSSAGALRSLWSTSLILTN